MAADTTGTDESIRQYLALINDASSLVDTELVDGLQKELEHEADPIERIKLRSRIERATEIPSEEIEQNFVEDVAKWIATNDITISSLISEGVAPEVLQSAGVELNGHAPKATKKRATKKKATKTKAKGSGTEAKDETETEAKDEAKPRATVDDAIKFINRTRKPFTVPDVIKSSEVSRATAMKALKQLLADGAVVETGEEEQSGRGRNAKLYERVTDKADSK